MAITFRHDAAGVVPPSNQTTRKYGQSLVLQQQQQKYDSQQAGYDRMFDAYKMENQNQIQQQRDWQQRDFVLNRDRDQNKLQQQQQRAADFTAARARMDTYAKDALSNPDLPPQLRQQIQNLVSGKMVAMGSGFNETQQQQFLDQYNAELAKLLSEVPAPKPQPTAADKFNQRKHFDEESGQWFIENSKGDFVPLVDPRQQQQQEKQQQQQLQQQEQEAEKMRPKSMEEYYSDNEDKFQKDLDSTMSSMQNDYDLDHTKPAPTRESALKKMQEDYDFRQQALGKPQYGEPTLAKPYGQALEDARQASSAGGKKENDAFLALVDKNEKLIELSNRAKSLPKGSKEQDAAWSAFFAERDRIIKGTTLPAPEMRSILEQPGQQPPAQSSSPSAPSPAAPTAAKPYGQTLGDAWNAYTKDQSQETFKKYRDAYRSNATLSDLADKAFALPEGSKEKKDAWDLFHAERDRIIGGATSPQAAPSSPTQAAPTPTPPPTPQGRFYGNDSYTNNAMDQAFKSLSNGKAPSQQAATIPAGPAASPAAPSQSDWDTLAAGQGLVDMGPAGQPTPAQPATPPKAPAIPSPSNAGQNAAKPVAPPDFGALASKADGVNNKQAITALQGIYQGQTPDVQSAIGVLLDSNAPRADRAQALAYLQSKGIDMKSLTATSKPSTPYRALNSGGR